MERSIVTSNSGACVADKMSTRRYEERVSIPNPPRLRILAHIVRAKLSREAAKPDPDMRRLVCHANLLDYLYTKLSSTSPQALNPTAK